MLSSLKVYLRQRGQVSLSDLCNHFNVPPDAMRGMLEQWIRRGKAQRIVAPKCDGCTQCDPAGMEIYAWLESGQAGRAVEQVIDASAICRK
jgi:hypothetical protein